ncbi:MAG: ABC transporter substrate-binding protein, partial [Schwartzia sp.]|nr:ABC transporter substrate-binding protein [Schwartzia sp. (in: firmicutes)]
MFIRKALKRIAVGLTAVAFAGVIAGCGGGEKKAGDANKKQYQVGIVQLVEHNALDAANKGF